MQTLGSRLCAGSPVVLHFSDLIVQQAQALKPGQRCQRIQVLQDVVQATSRLVNISRVIAACSALVSS